MLRAMPKLWSDTIDEHRREVRDAILDATAKLVMKRGLASVSMSDIASEAGIGRATLYKYFADVESIMHAWHERQIGQHLRELAAARDAKKKPDEKLRVVLEKYASIAHEKHDVELSALLHRGDHFVHAHKELAKLIRALIKDGAKAKVFRDDVPADELARYCIHALSAASTVDSPKAVKRLVAVTMSALARP
jgi:AcrR family transcriptional regulator